MGAFFCGVVLEDNFAFEETETVLVLVFSTSSAFDVLVGF